MTDEYINLLRKIETGEAARTERLQAAKLTAFFSAEFFSDKTSFKARKTFLDFIEKNMRDHNGIYFLRNAFNDPYFSHQALQLMMDISEEEAQNPQNPLVLEMSVHSLSEQQNQLEARWSNRLRK